MLTFEIPAVKCRDGIEVNWSRYRDTGVTAGVCSCNDIMQVATSLVPGMFIN